METSCAEDNQEKEEFKWYIVGLCLLHKREVGDITVVVVVMEICRCDVDLQCSGDTKLLKSEEDLVLKERY